MTKVHNRYFTEKELELIHTSLEGEEEVAKDDGNTDRVSFLGLLFDKTLKAEPVFSDEEKEWLTEVANDWKEEEPALANSIIGKATR